MLNSLVNSIILTCASNLEAAGYSPAVWAELSVNQKSELIGLMLTGTFAHANEHLVAYFDACSVEDWNKADAHLGTIIGLVAVVIYHESLRLEADADPRGELN